MLFKVRLKDGREQWVFCHLEIQTSFEADFEARVQLYNAGLTWMFRKDVLTLVILADVRPNWRPCERTFQLAEFETTIRFPICKVLDRLETDWADDVSLPAQVARAQIAALRTASDPVGRLYAKTQLVRNLYDAGYTADGIRELYRLIDWIMHLRPDLARRFASEHIAFEKDRKMPYVTSIERFALARGREEGREEGREQGSVKLLLLQLTRLCGTLPEDIERKIRQLTLDQSQSLGQDLLGFQTLDELRDWLKTNSN